MEDEQWDLHERAADLAEKKCKVAELRHQLEAERDDPPPPCTQLPGCCGQCFSGPAYPFSAGRSDREVWLEVEGVGRDRGRFRGRMVRQWVEEAEYGSRAWFMRTIQLVRHVLKWMLKKHWDLDERAAALAERKLEFEDLHDSGA